MCHLLSAFRPKDVYPCVTDEESWAYEVSIDGLFGHLCTGSNFCYDQEMRSNHNIGGPPPFESSPQQRSSLRAESAAPEQVSSDIDVDDGPVRGLPASNRSKSANASVPGPKPCSVKRQGSLQLNRRKKSQRKYCRDSRERSNWEDVPGLAGSFFEWIGSSGTAPMPTNRTTSRLASGGNVNATPRASGAGAQQTPVELSDPSESETESEEETNRESPLESTVNELTKRASSGETQLSMPDSAFVSQGSGSFDPTTKASQESRIQHRKEVYRAIRTDDGHVWGNTYGLLSTSSGHEDDLEL